EFVRIAGNTPCPARELSAEALRESGCLDGEPLPTQRMASVFERGDKRLEIVSTRQWYITNGGRDTGLRDELIKRGDEISWVPAYMQSRYTNWIDDLNGDWLISRHRHVGLAFPNLYRIASGG